MAGGQISNLQVLNVIEQKLSRKRSSIYVKNIQVTYMLKALITANLVQALGEKSKHFTVSVNTSGISNRRVSVRTKTALGSYIYYGTKRHSISASGPMPIGQGRFANRVNHPGQKEMKPIIDKAVKKAFLQARIYVRMTK